MEALDLDMSMLSLDPRTAEPDEAPGVTVDLPICDQYGSRYLSSSDAARVLGISRGLVERQLSGDIYAARGFRFTFGG
jgi:hypothetical protein